MIKKIRLILIIIASLTIIGFIIFFIIDANRSANISILVTPLDSSITINGKKYTNGTYRFFPGEVSVKIEHDGLDSKEYSLELSSSTTTLLYDYLTSNGDFSYYSSHKDDYEALKFIQNDETLNYISRQEKANSIVDILPLTVVKQYPSTYYRVAIKNASTESDCLGVVCLEIKDDSENHIASADLLKEYGYDLDDYQIFYASY